MARLAPMVRPLLLTFVAGACALATGCGGAGKLVDAQGRRVFVADGDTLRIGEETVRLAGMDAVERGQFCRDAQGSAWSCGQTALAALTDMVARGGLLCATIEHDRYSRAVARCSVAGEKDVAAAMVAAGWAVADGPAYATQQQSARDAKRGLWAGSFEAPSIWRTIHRIAPRSAR